MGPDPIAARTPTFEFTADLRATADPARAIRAIAPLRSVYLRGLLAAAHTAAPAGIR